MSSEELMTQRHNAQTAHAGGHSNMGAQEEIRHVADGMYGVQNGGRGNMGAQEEIRRNKKIKRVCSILVPILLVLLVIDVWVISGLAMRAGLLPYFDLWYTSFDANFFVLFGF